MRAHKVWTIVGKEWRELRANRMLLFAMALPALIFTLIPIGLVIAALRAPMSQADMAQLAHSLKNAPGAHGADGREAILDMIVHNWIGFFLQLPVLAPIIISAQSIVGERERRTIEPLLAAPIDATELLLGKTLAALLPGVGITWAGFLLFAVTADAAVFPSTHHLLLPDATWAFAMLVLVPLLALFGNGASVVISSRVNDARTAQQIAGISVLPLVGIFVVQMARGSSFGPAFYFKAALVLAVIDVVLYRAAVRLFNRERILTSLR